MCFAVLGTAVSFAESDLQVQAGVQYTKVSSSIPVNLSLTTSDIDFSSDRIAAQLNITNYNLFNVNSRFQVGFMESIGGYYGVTGNNQIKNDELGVSYHPDGAEALGVSALVGPALAIKLNNVVKLQGAFGFCCDFNSDIFSNSETATVSTLGFAYGYGADVEMKFIPNGIVSPVIGFRYTNTKSKPQLDYTINTEVIDVSDTTKSAEVSYQSFLAMIGLSINL
jgi:hypothetical protein